MARWNFASWRPILSNSILFGLAALVGGCATVKSSDTRTVDSVVVTVTPASASVQISGTQKFMATVANTSNTAVTWQVNGTAGGDSTHGTIDATGMYTAPAAVPSPAAVTVSATAMADPTKSAAAKVTVSASTQA
jgi:hypothetical protein